MWSSRRWPGMNVRFEFYLTAVIVWKSLLILYNLMSFQCTYHNSQMHLLLHANSQKFTESQFCQRWPIFMAYFLDLCRGLFSWHISVWYFVYYITHYAILLEFSKDGKTLTVAQKELRLIQSKGHIENPKICVKAVHLWPLRHVTRNSVLRCCC